AKYNGSHRARKSFFFLGNRIIALGTDIENDDANHPTETTLFQRHLKRRDMAMMLSTEGVLTGFPLERTICTEEFVWMTDPQGNGYVVPPGQTLKVSRQRQTSPHQKNDEPTVGDFAVAWLSHGSAPRDETYEFAVLVQAGAEETASFAEAM